MNFDSDFWFTVFSTLIQVAIALIGIWIGIWFALKQQNSEQLRKYDQILTQQSDLSDNLILVLRELAKLRGTVGTINQTTMQALLEAQQTNRQALIGLIQERNNKPLSFTDSDYPDIAR